MLLLAAVLGLDTADTGAIGALAPQLEVSLRIGTTQLGLLVAASSFVGAVAALPAGVLTDRSNRVRLLVAAVVAWSAGMAASGLAPDYLVLVAVRLEVGVAIGVVGPVVASLTGDLFPPEERSRVYGFILTGDLVGAGAGLLVAGDLGAVAGWRAAFFVLAAVSLGIAFAVHRGLHEPARGGHDWLRREVPAPEQPSEGRSAGGDSVRRRARRRRDLHPSPGLVLDSDPQRMNLRQAARYVLRIGSNRVLIVVSALGYFFLAGLRTYAVEFARGHFGLGQAVVTVLIAIVGAGAVAGTIAGGRLCDRLIGRGVLDGRLWVGGVALVVSAVLFVPGLLLTAVPLALPALILAAAALTAPNAAVDAARLDIVPSRLWGRAESVRTLTRALFEGSAPLVVGLVASYFGAPSSGFGAGVSVSANAFAAAAAPGLGDAFLVMLAPLALSGVILLLSRRAYLVDMVTADASEKASRTG